ncbi:helix-turn-helix domain-containing protein [Streptomyces sp. NPDC058572]|uniref:helix-turn-helix domain-containing protein n=1 Tax=Streptomyces sp. NPDC058572 TaxID=3346546 RepID=UPI00365C02AC
MVTVTDELLTVPEVMARLKVGRTAVYDLIRTRRLPSLTIGRSRRIPADALRAFLASRLEEAA